VLNLNTESIISNFGHIFNSIGCVDQFYMLKYFVEILQSSSVEIKEKEAIKLLYHHARPFESVKYNIVVPSLDLRKAERILVRNQKTKNGLEEMGFSNVNVFRLTLNE